jgi:hypothetical protein
MNTFLEKIANPFKFWSIYFNPDSLKIFTDAAEQIRPLCTDVLFRNAAEALKKKGGAFVSSYKLHNLFFPYQCSSSFIHFDACL